MSEPWMKFYTTDWRSDPRLRMCGLAARGLWIEMIAVMHEATPYGHLVVSGQSPTDAQLAVLAGAPPDLIPELVGELESAGVFSRTKEGVIYSRKMTRMAKKAAVARKNGKNGGNPTLSKTYENSSSDNQNQTNKDKPQKPEARVQKERKTEPDGSAKSTPFEELCRVLDPDRARSVVEHRQRLRKPMTPRAAQLLARELDAWGDANQAADEMVCRGWQCFKAEWLERAGVKRPEKPREGPAPVILHSDDPLVPALERLRGRPLIFGQRGTTSVSRDEIERARSGALL